MTQELVLEEKAQMEMVTAKVTSDEGTVDTEVGVEGIHGQKGARWVATYTVRLRKT